MDELNVMLDKIKQTRSIPSDNALATLLHVKRQSVSSWRKGRVLPDNETAAVIARLAGIPELRVVAQINEARARSIAEKALWRRLANVAAVVAIVVIATAFPKPAMAEAHGDQLRIMYIMFKSA